MKRFVAMLFLVLVLCTASAWAESIDLDAMSIDELIVLRGRIEDALADRLQKSSEPTSDIIYMGVYVCGADIKPGRYLVTGLDSYAFEMDLYADASAMESGDCLIDEYLFSGQTYDLEIEDGMVLKVSRGSAKITPREKPSWAP